MGAFSETVTWHAFPWPARKLFKLGPVTPIKVAFLTQDCISGLDMSMEYCMRKANRHVSGGRKATGLQRVSRVAISYLLTRPGDLGGPVQTR
jgi:hypothetical protein